MADSPPPLDDVEINGEEEEEKEEDTTLRPDPEPQPEEEPLFAETEQPVEKKVVVEQPEPVVTSFPAPTLEATAAVEGSPEPVVKPTTSSKEVEPPAATKTLDLFADDEEAEVCSSAGKDWLKLLGRCLFR